MKYFLFSDVHGEYTALITSLEEAGFDIKNPKHFLIGVGDYFDRGPENLEVLQFIFEMYMFGRIKLIQGNHDFMLLNFLKNGHGYYSDIIYNGLDKTILQLAGHQPVSSKGYIIDAADFLRQIILKKHFYLMDFLESMTDIVQIENNIITHAGYDMSENGELYVNHWNHVETMIEKHLDKLDPNLTYIFGHWHAFRLNKKFNIETDNQNKFVYKNLIGIDATTNITKKVTIHVIETEVNIF